MSSTPTPSPSTTAVVCSTLMLIAETSSIATTSVTCLDNLDSTVMPITSLASTTTTPNVLESPTPGECDLYEPKTAMTTADLTPNTTTRGPKAASNSTRQQIDFASTCFTITTRTPSHASTNCEPDATSQLTSLPPVKSTELECDSYPSLRNSSKSKTQQTSIAMVTTRAISSPSSNNASTTRRQENRPNCNSTRLTSTTIPVNCTKKTRPPYATTMTTPIATTTRIQTTTASTSTNTKMTPEVIKKPEPGRHFMHVERKIG
ncbi:unnamed protein product [Protopolystoma xenopodis]|uniref:Uncharacterized protein n=1 Tax=Protopolystoma xenopodis TaxID=117903 RepID=A0A3S5CLG5_9PLAT|nr:unnamed protein product [Protopolystoma xenopodis]